MGILADVFDVVREGAGEVKDNLEDLCEPLRDDLAYIWAELADMWRGDDSDD